MCYLLMTNIKNLGQLQGVSITTGDKDFQCFGFIKINFDKVMVQTKKHCNNFSIQISK